MTFEHVEFKNRWIAADKKAFAQIELSRQPTSEFLCLFFLIGLTDNIDSFS